MLTDSDWRKVAIFMVSLCVLMFAIIPAARLIAHHFNFS